MESDNWELMNCLCKGKRRTFIVNQILSKIQELQDKMISLIEKKIFDLEIASSSGMSHVPSQPSRFPSPRGMLRRYSVLSRHTRNSMGTSGDVFEDALVPEGPSPSFFVDPKDLTSFSYELRQDNTGNTMRHEEGLRQESQSSTRSSPRLSRNYETWNRLHHIGWIHTQNCMMDVPKCTILELHFGNSQTDMMSSVGESISRPNDFRTSRLIEGKSCPDFEMVDAGIVSALRRIIFRITTFKFFLF